MVVRVLRAEQACAACGETFVPPNSRVRRYCSVACSQKCSRIGHGPRPGAKALWRCPVDGIGYAQHPKCGGMRSPHAYGHHDVINEKREQAGKPTLPRRCGILVGPGHAYGVQELFQDGRCRSCHVEETRPLVPLVVHRYATDWDAEIPVAWVAPGPPTLRDVTDPAKLAKRRRYAYRGQERSA